MLRFGMTTLADFFTIKDTYVPKLELVTGTEEFDHFFAVKIIHHYLLHFLLVDRRAVGLSTSINE